VPDIPSTRPLPAKLGIKPGFAVCLLRPPAGFAAGLTPLPADVTFTARPGSHLHLFIAFARSTSELSAHLTQLGPVVARQTLWLAWPKKMSGVATDVDGNVVRAAALDEGWVDFKVCAVDATWSGLAFKKRR
jgi:hypothetical protein